MLIFISIFVTIYGVVGALGGAAQALKIRKRKSSDDVSLLFFFIYGFGYVVWLVYGLVFKDVPLIVVDTVGIMVTCVNLYFILKYRNSSTINEPESAR